jgi:AraC-like DNA-binding protein
MNDASAYTEFGYVCDVAYLPREPALLETILMSQLPNGARTDDLLPVATFLTPTERLRVDAVGEGYYRTMHRENVDDLIQDIKTHQAFAVLVSVTCAGAHASRVASLVREFPRIPAVALLSELEAKTPHAVLALGRSGIRRLVDVRLPAGWRELRGALMADTGDNGQRSALGQLAIDLAGAPEDCWIFFETLFTCSPRVGNVRMLAKHLGVLPSTMMSRFFRADVPAPKRYLAMVRLVRAARLFENAGFSIANVATHMDYSSPQSFGRHIRTVLNVTAGEFRMLYDGAGMFDRFRQELILPYLSILETFHPLAALPGWIRDTHATREPTPASQKNPGTTLDTSI